MGYDTTTGEGRPVTVRPVAEECGHIVNQIFHNGILYYSFCYKCSGGPDAFDDSLTVMDMILGTEEEIMRIAIENRREEGR